jgi:hypothetical protein
MAQNKLVNDLEYMPFSAHIEPFAPTLSPLIAESLMETSQDRYRKGTFLTPTLSIWFVLAMTIRRDLNYHKVLDWMSSTWRWMMVALPAKLVQDGAISHARVKLGVDVLLLLFQKVAFLLSSVESDFHGFVTVIFDGTTLSMPDTPSNHERFGKHKSSRGSSGFPLMRVVTLMIRAGRVMVDVAFAPIVGKGTGERTLMHQILPRVKLHNALFLFDAGFYSFVLLHGLHRFTHHFIMKVSSSVHVTPLRRGRFPDGSYLAVIRGKIEAPARSRSKRKAYCHLAYLVRVIDVQIPGFRPFRLITNLLDHSISAKELVRHYHQRWDIELGYDEIKTHQCATLRGQAPTILRSKRADLVEQELYALLITYNLTRCLMLQAAKEHGVDPLKISFLDTLQWIVEAVAQMDHTNSEQHTTRQHKYLHRLISESLIDRPRRLRTNQRVIKVKSSKFRVKRKHHRSQTIDYEKETQILPPNNVELIELKAA